MAKNKTQATIISEKMERFFGIIYRDNWDNVTDDDLLVDFKKYWADVVKPDESIELATMNVPQLILKSSDLDDFTEATLVRGVTSIHLQVANRVYAILPYVSYGGALRGNTIVVPRPQLALSPLLKRSKNGNIVNPNAWIWYEETDSKPSGFFQTRQTKITPKEAFLLLKPNQLEQIKYSNNGVAATPDTIEEIFKTIEFIEIERGDLREYVVLGIDEMFAQIRQLKQTTSKRSRYILKYVDQMNVTFDDTEQNNPNVIVHVHKGNYRMKVDKYTSTLVSLASQYTKNRELYGMSYYYDPVFITDNRKAGLIFKLQAGVEINNGTLYRNGKNPWDLTPKDITDCEDRISSHPFIQNNGLKRQWMYEKFLDQAMYLTTEEDYFLKARVVLTELYGATLESGIVISESFAKRAETAHKLQMKIDSNEGGTDDLRMDVFYDRYPELAHMATELRLTESGNYVYAKFNIPLSVGDKLTNMHGNKGTVSMILPDSEMPYIEDTIGNVEPGPAEIVLSNNIVDRKTYGQLVEIFSLSNDAPEIENIKDFLESGLPDNTLANVAIRGESFKRTSGLMTFCVMEHFSAIKQTIPSKKFLKIGEMETLLIGAMNQDELMLEILSNSPTRRSDFRTQRLTNKPSENIFNNAVVDILNSLGLDLKIDKQSLHTYNNTAPTESSVEDWKKSLSDIIK